ncbi:hypothetical protein [Paracoccus suum]|uniref:hypothetical protein n=1 Tax=Paracoccus suum TaxID=2259340 RepID=UPI0013B04C9F|nr:hypothetical protein [Paracoccus suum]
MDLLDSNREMVEVRRLFTVAFKSQTFRLVDDVIARTIGGETYQPAFGWLEAGAINRGAVLDAEPAIYRVTSLGPDTPGEFASLMIAALHDEAEWRAAKATYAVQLLLDGAAVGPAIVMHTGWIADIKPAESVAQAGLTIRVESNLARRNWTPLGEYTDRDQQARYPGDKAMQFVASLKDKVITGWLKG